MNFRKDWNVKGLPLPLFLISKNMGKEGRKTRTFLSHAETSFARTSIQRRHPGLGPRRQRMRLRGIFVEGEEVRMKVGCCGGWVCVSCGGWILRCQMGM